MPKKMNLQAYLNENEEGISGRNMLNCFSCNFETENLDELDEHILINHDGDVEDEVPEQKFQIVQDEPPARIRKRKVSDIIPTLPKDIPRARIIVKKHDPKFQIETKIGDEKKKVKYNIGGTKRAKRTPAEDMQCTLCSFTTRKKSVLATHMLNHSDVIPPVYYKCSQCPYQTKRKNDMPKHMLGHCTNDSVPLYKCRSCPYVTKRKGDLPKHEMNHAERNEMFSWNCTECEYFSKRKNDLHKHMLIHSDRQLAGLYKCLKCTYVTDKVVKFSRHVLSGCSSCENPISLEHLMLEDILASVDHSGVHVVLDGESEDEQEYQQVQYEEGDEEAMVEEYQSETVEENATVIVEGEVVDQQFIEIEESNEYVVNDERTELVQVKSEYVVD
ncbi:zinc finger protein 335-like [Diorhabda carinulata]|uniref:zinc finger protein 335-like n=1 Tax=Diorhabda carinulata TaxID=1163345 RepID=UPI0025A1B4BD|nr:zinc finger protein 335-like [Diorhabda carinulata]XP_057656122.1 zinc finger protein 335-like [Diorhabda carinulata]